MQLLSIDGGASPRVPPAGTPQLFTATLATECCGGTLQAFAAIVAREPAALEFALACRFGTAAAAAADVRKGFDPGLPLADALVAPALADMLLQIASHPTCPLADGLDLVVEQWFRA